MKNKALIILLAMLAALAGGCWDRRDPEKLGYIIATGFDYNEEEEYYHIVVQVARPIAMQTEAGGGESPDEAPFWVVSADGRTPYEAMLNLAEGSSRELFWAHNRILVFSEALAKKGIQPVLDIFIRNPQLRLIARPMVVEGNLRTLMECEYPLEEIGGEGLVRHVESLMQQRATFPMRFTTEIYNNLAQPGLELFLGKIEVLENGENEESEDGNEDTGEPPPARVGGGAAFRGDQMVGWTSALQVLGWMYITERAVRTPNVIELPEPEGTRVAVEINAMQSEIRPVEDGDDLRIELELTVEFNIMDVLGSGELDTDSEMIIASIERRTAEFTRTEIEDMIQRTQELNSDITGFGNLIYRKKPLLWSEIEDEWDTIFPELIIDIDIETTVHDAGLVRSPLKGGGR